MKKIKFFLPLLAFAIAIVGGLSSFASEDSSLATLVPDHFRPNPNIAVCFECDAMDPNYNVTYTCALAGAIRCKCIRNNVLIDAVDNPNVPACQILWQVPIE